MPYKYKAKALATKLASPECMAHRAAFGNRTEFRLRSEVKYLAASAWMWGCEDQSCTGTLDEIVEACRWSEQLYGRKSPITGEPNIIGGCDGVVCGACCACLCGSSDERDD